MFSEQLIPDEMEFEIYNQIIFSQNYLYFLFIQRSLDFENI